MAAATKQQKTESQMHPFVEQSKKQLLDIINDAHISSEITATMGWQTLYQEHHEYVRKRHKNLSHLIKQLADNMALRGWDEDDEKLAKQCIKDSAGLRSDDEVFNRDTVAPIIVPFHRYREAINNMIIQAEAIKKDQPLHCPTIVDDMAAMIDSLPQVLWDSKTGRIEVVSS